MDSKKLVLILSFFLVFSACGVSAQTMGNKLKGRILLQVESHGEAWYVNPATEEIHFMGRPNDAFSLMRELGTGISNANLEKVQIADSNLEGMDDDKDGLSNMVEDALGTNKNNKDSDNDGTDDKTELLRGINPAKKTKYAFDKNFAARLQGKILLQVESHGEAWYVNPADNKRYFLGRPQDAFNLMRKLGLGIKNNDLEKINRIENKSQNGSSNLQAPQNQGSSGNNLNNIPQMPYNFKDYNDYLKFLIGPNYIASTTPADINAPSRNNGTEKILDHSDDNESDQSEPGDHLENIPQPAVPNYKTAKNLSTVTFSRDITGPYNENTTVGARNQNVAMKITGYLKEVTPSSHELTQYSDKAYEFAEGLVEWDIREYLNDGDTIKCTYIYETSGKDKDYISNLNVPYDTNDGKDDQGKLLHLNSYDLRIGYKQNDFFYNKSKIEILGSLLIPIQETDSIIHNKQNLICDNTTETDIWSKKETAIVKFPIKLLGVAPSGKQTGSLTAYESISLNDKSKIVSSSTGDVDFGYLPFVGEITIDNSKAPWNVTWDLEFPE